MPEKKEGVAERFEVSIDPKEALEVLRDLTNALGDIEDVLKAMDYFLHTLASRGSGPQG